MEFKYITDTPSLGGRIKNFAEDFVVCEIGKDYSTYVKYLPDKKVEEINWDDVFNQNTENKDFLILTMEKINLSTTTAISQMSRFLRLSKKRISYAGLKDKRAMSSQKISLYQPEKERLSKFYFKNIKVYDPVWSNDKIDIGDLKENHFIITIRQIENKTEEEIKEIILNCIQQINKKGLINYFGEQRFGGIRDITHKVGKLVLQGDYKSAIILYLTETFDLEREDIKQARLALKQDLDFPKHAAHFPSKTGYESAILNYLAKNPTDFLGAFKILPKSIQYLFTHAYQSYLFNELINLRIDRGYGIEKIDGDRLDKNGVVLLPLFGYESCFSKGLAGDLEKEVLDREGITFKYFFNKDHSVFSSKGEFRKIKTEVRDLKLLEVSDDLKNKEEMNNPKKAIVSFILDKGQYATVFLREIIKKEIIG
ncbi:MAG: tRNA pseudouridine(13) synthase TruD [Candidatus ainarchaeum sp.]|nr:tRNA pseudouridine(13) synthase TruD [Candidatus ainarchaeum sp.]